MVQLQRFTDKPDSGSPQALIPKLVLPLQTVKELY